MIASSNPQISPLSAISATVTLADVGFLADNPNAIPRVHKLDQRSPHFRSQPAACVLRQCHNTHELTTLDTGPIDAL
jgi:hypothetical protein